jgi:hypothetical protein
MKTKENSNSAWYGVQSVTLHENFHLLNRNLNYQINSGQTHKSKNLLTGVENFSQD